MDARRLLAVLFWTCLAVEVAFFLLDATVNYARWTDYGMIRRLFNIAREDSLPSWFGTTQTWMVGLTLWVLFLVARRDRRSRFVVVGWLLLAVFFTYMAADDGAEIHERMGSAFKKTHTTYAETEAIDTFGERVLDAFPSYSWQIVFMPFFGTMGLFMLIFLWRELKEPAARGRVVLALGLLSAGVLLDFIEGLDEHHPMNAYTAIAEEFDLMEFSINTFDRRPYDALRHFSKSSEEFMEMFATTLLWVTFLGHLMLRYKEFGVAFALPDKKPEHPKGT